MPITSAITIAVPKGRILKELEPLLSSMDITPEPAFFDKDSRLLMFNTSDPNVTLIRVRSFDVATFVAFGGADIGIAGSDVLAEFSYPDLIAPVDLNIGACRMSIAAMNEKSDNIDFAKKSHIRIATKYPVITKQYFANLGVQAECIKLNGAIEIAPKLGLSDYIVDLVSTGSTLKANGLQEIANIMEISSKLVVNRNSSKTKSETVNYFIKEFQKLVC